MKLTRTQLNYAEGRLHVAMQKKLDMVKAPPVPVLSYEDKYALIKAGKAVLKPLKDIPSSYTDLEDAFTYPEHDKAVVLYEAALKKHRSELEALRSKLVKERSSILDKLYLGDAEEALRLIEAFSK